MTLSDDEIVFLDTNIVMYAVGGEHPYRLPCQKVMVAIASDALKAAIDTEIVQEILHRYGSLQRYTEAPDLSASIAECPAGGDSGATAEASRPPSPEGLAQLELESCARQALSKCRLDEFGKGFPPRAHRRYANPLQPPRNQRRIAWSGRRRLPLTQT
jgi:hypothetical protein